MLPPTQAADDDFESLISAKYAHRRDHYVARGASTNQIVAEFNCDDVRRYDRRTTLRRRRVIEEIDFGRRCDWVRPR